MSATTRVLRTIKISVIKSHPTNQRIYGPADDGLVEDIRAYGLQVPPEITAGDSVLISGYRRLAACRKLGITEVQCIVRHDLTNPLAVETAIVMANRYRDKTNDQKAAEVAWLTHIEEQKAERRKSRSMFASQMPKSQTAQTTTDSAPVSYPEKIGENARDDLSLGEKGKSLAIAGEAVGWSENTARAAVEVHEAIVAAESAGDTEKAADLRQTLNEEGVKPAQRKVRAEGDGVEVCDRLGNKVPGPLVVTFEGAAAFSSIIHRSGVFRSDLIVLRASPAGARLTQDAEVLVDKLQNELRNARPYCECPSCHGMSAINSKPCDLCRETGFLIESQYLNLTEEQRKQIPGAQ